MVFFDGTNWFQTSSNFTPNSNVSVCVWLRPTELTGGTKYRVFGSDNALEFRYLNDRIEADFFESGATPMISDTDLFIWQWHHVVITRASDEQGYIYVDGEEDGSRANNDNTPSAGQLLVGASPVSSERYKGYMEDLRIYDRVLSNNEIRTIALAQGKDFILNGLTNWWLFTEGTHNEEVVTIEDRIGSLDLTQQKSSTYYPQAKEPLFGYMR